MTATLGCEVIRDKHDYLASKGSKGLQRINTRIPNVDASVVVVVLDLRS